MGEAHGATGRGRGIPPHLLAVLAAGGCVARIHGVWRCVARLRIVRGGVA